MNSKTRSSHSERDMKSGKSQGKSSGAGGGQQHGHRHQGGHSSHRRSKSPIKGRQGATGAAASSSSRVELSKKTHRFSPFRKLKPAPVNELDLLTLSQKEKESKSGNRGKGGTHDRPEKVQYRQRAGLMDRRGFWGSRSNGFGSSRGIDYRRTPMFPPRRGIGGGDVADRRVPYGRNNRQFYQRNTEHKRPKEDEEKPVMNLFDPCKVPTGRSYFTHDDRSSKPVRPSRPRYSGSGDNGWQSLPVGWRNVRKVRRNDDDLHDDDFGASSKKRTERNPADEVWKHDMFEDDES